MKTGITTSNLRRLESFQVLLERLCIDLEMQGFRSPRCGGDWNKGQSHVFQERLHVCQTTLDQVRKLRMLLCELDKPEPIVNAEFSL